MNELFRSIAIAFNSARNESLDKVAEVEFALAQLGCKHSRFPLGVLEDNRSVLPGLSGNALDMVVVIGGDGTLLAAARKFHRLNVPLLGLNVGHLGFLNESQNPTDLIGFFASIFEGNYRLEDRTMLCGRVLSAQENSSDTDEQLIALNDIVISRSSRSHLLNITIQIDGDEITECSADGLIVCTPTGSTAYALAAGGAVLAPGINGFGIVPICPHSLTSRPLVISDDVELQIKVKPKNRRQSLITVQADGQDTYLLEQEDRVLIKRAPVTTKLLRSSMASNNFYQVLSKKLLWGRSA